MLIAVCTARIGPKSDPLRDPSYVAPGVRYLCASDTPVESAVWRRVEVEAGDDPVLAARRWKILLHEQVQAAFTVWIDARFTLHVDPAIFVPMLMGYDVLAMRHPRCKTLADEAREIAARGLVARRVLDAQMREYGDEVVNDPHYSTGLLAMRNDRRCAVMTLRWLAELDRWGHTRDQMSFGYAASAAAADIGPLEGTYLDNPYATWGRDG
jgi:TOD1/MUCI70, glycosyltransferase-like domain